MLLKIVKMGKGKEFPAYSVFVKDSETAQGQFITINPDVCTGCNICVDICQVDIFAPNPVKGDPPYLLHYDECQHCGACVMHCPLAAKGAIKYEGPAVWKMRWKRKDTGEHFRVGLVNHPEPCLRKPIPGSKTWKGGP